MLFEIDNVGIIFNYLFVCGIDDVCNDLEIVVSLLVWSEQSDVWWEEGWCESFLYCVGMYLWFEICFDF